jgi:hypothetical protein
VHDEINSKKVEIAVDDDDEMICNAESLDG